MATNNLKIEFGKKLKKLRKLKNITQETFAENIGIAPRNISKIETGQTFPSVENLEKIIKFLECKPEDLFKFRIFDEKINKKTYIKAFIDKLDNEKINILYEIIKTVE